LTDGQIATLDSNKGIVYKGSVMDDDEMIPTISYPS
jgi:phosphohistidine swiveling domain-containing protein